jgi:hypothetical protein
MKITINLSKEQIRHLKSGCSSKWDCCGIYQKVIEKLEKRVRSLRS